MAIEYPNLTGEIAKRGIKKVVIANALSISEKALYNKLHGISPFTWNEVCIIKERFFPDMDKDVLFKEKFSEDAS